jgi:hypothetical protein
MSTGGDFFYAHQPEHYWPRLPTTEKLKSGAHQETLLSEALVDAKPAFKFAQWFVDAAAVSGSVQHNQSTHPKQLAESLIYDQRSTIVGYDVVSRLSIPGKVFTLSLSEDSIRLYIQPTNRLEPTYEYSLYRGDSLPTIRYAKQLPGNVPPEVTYIEVEPYFRDTFEKQEEVQQDWEI